eukprot:Gb_01706 [translate_table: standard]
MKSLQGRPFSFLRAPNNKEFCLQLIVRKVLTDSPLFDIKLVHLNFSVQHLCVIPAVQTDSDLLYQVHAFDTSLIHNMKKNSPIYYKLKLRIIHSWTIDQVFNFTFQENQDIDKENCKGRTPLRDILLGMFAKEEDKGNCIVRDRPVPIPGSGVQLTNISHVRDLSSMLVLAVEKPAAASGNVFNAVSDRAITFDGLVRLCAKAAGREVNIIHYDPKSLGIDAKKAFPFRNMHFYAEPRTAKEILGWRSTTNLPEDLNERFAEYVGIGRDKKDMKFELDDKILESSSVAVTV